MWISVPSACPEDLDQGYFALQLPVLAETLQVQPWGHWLPFWSQPASIPVLWICWQSWCEGPDVFTHPRAAGQEPGRWCASNRPNRSSVTGLPSSKSIQEGVRIPVLPRHWSESQIRVFQSRVGSAGCALHPVYQEDAQQAVPAQGKGWEA